MSTPMPLRADVAIVGGGLAGLAAAALLAREGQRVQLFERSTSLGGRAQTEERDGFAFNLGPHALYTSGEAAAVLTDLGIHPAGGYPNTAGLVRRNGRFYQLPTGLRSLLTTRLMGPRGKLETARALARLPKLDVERLADASFHDWLHENIRDDSTRDLVRGIARVATYVSDPGALSAKLAVGQVQLALRGVRYLDGGWSQLVDRLVASAWDSGATLQTGARVTAVQRDGSGWRLVFRDRPPTEARSIILAGSPEMAAQLLDGAAVAGLRTRAGAYTPARVAALDLGLRGPAPTTTFAVGLDAPLYFSTHSAAARLAPDGDTLIHVAKYLPTGDEAGGVEQELEAWTDSLAPGWRDRVAVRRFLPHLTVLHDVAATLEERQPVEVRDAPGLFLAGDWVGDRGWLADASLASAKRAADAVIAHNALRYSSDAAEAPAAVSAG